MLRSLGLIAEPPTLEFLCRLIRAWLFTVPFHNLDLLSGESPYDEEGAAEKCLHGHGGGCHVHAAGFRALLATLGFNASLASASIGAADDHLIISVRFDDGLYWIDVGNGQPYLMPFPDSREQLISHLGWQIRSVPSDSGVRLLRKFPDRREWHQIYETNSPLKTWEHFARSIRRHHEESGFGPFLTGLRVVEIGSHQMRTLRDDILSVYNRSGSRTTRIKSDTELIAVATDIVPQRSLAIRAVRSWRDNLRAHAGASP